MEEDLVINNNTLPQDLKAIQAAEITPANLKRKQQSGPDIVSPKKAKTDDCDSIPITKPHSSPKKKINFSSNPDRKNKFIYGNYNRYYGYRNPKDYHDVRLDIFEANKELFVDKEVLDIGCNSGFITMEIAKNFKVNHITGIDIDKGLVNKTTKSLCKTKKSCTSGDRKGFPFNLNFVHGNYVLRDDVLLEIERPQFDLILCLSVTKWIHLNFGDNALKQTFRRMHSQLKENGKLILEAQPWDGYKRRKKLTPEILKNYQSISFKPADFTNYLLSQEVGFKSVTLLAVPDHCAEGFRRPIQLFSK